MSTGDYKGVRRSDTSLLPTWKVYKEKSGVGDEG